MLFRFLILFFFTGSCFGSRVALLVNGGYGPSSNFSAFSEELQNWYPALVSSGYSSTDIYVIDSDGPDNSLPPWRNPMLLPSFGGPFSSEYRTNDSYFWYRGIDYGMGDIRANWVDSPKDYDGDGITDCRYDATVSGFDSVTSDMSLSGDSDDELLVVLISHGGVNSVTGSYQFGIWDYDEQSPGDFESRGVLMQGEDLASYIDRIPYSKRMIVTNSCYSGSAWQHFANGNTVMMVNAADDEIGWVGNPVLDINAPITFESGLSMLGHTLPDSFLSRVSDTNRDGVIMWREAYDYAYSENPFGPEVSDPIWIGGSYGWAIEHPSVYDPSGLLTDWIFSTVLYGDSDNDGDIDLDDFTLLKVNFGTGATWRQGDFDGDGDIDLDDFALLKVNMGSNIVPEPSSLFLILFGMFCLLRLGLAG